MEELRRQNQILEEETIAQRHIIHLEKIKTEQESRELEEQRNQLMLDLEQEKQRLEDDIDKMHRNKVSIDLPEDINLFLLIFRTCAMTHTSHHLPLVNLY